MLLLLDRPLVQTEHAVGVAQPSDDRDVCPVEVQLDDWCAPLGCPGGGRVACSSPTTPRSQRRTQARQRSIAELVRKGQLWGGRLDAQDAGAERRGRPLFDSGAKARMYHAVKDAHLPHRIKVDLHQEAFSFSIDEQRERYLELLDGKLLPVAQS